MASATSGIAALRRLLGVFDPNFGFAGQLKHKTRSRRNTTTTLGHQEENGIPNQYSFVFAILSAVRDACAWQQRPRCIKRRFGRYRGVVGACLSRATENDGSACNDGNRSVSVPEQVRRGEGGGGPKVQMEESLSFGSNAFEMADGDGTGRRAMVYLTATVYEDGRGPEFGWCCAGKPRWDCLRARAMEWNLNGSGEWKRGQSVEGQQGQGVTGEEGCVWWVDGGGQASDAKVAVATSTSMYCTRAFDGGGGVG
ncbi:hypothetical protein B0T13DRAFT_506679 [Neurospora crassa]|nr:hypothetical protein B0T13DRAFT_506679 [Neurospora crassa]